MIEYAVDHPEVIAAAFSALATVFAALATWLGPRSAAKLGEKLRRDAESQQEQRRLKMFVFTTLMQERAMIWSQDAVRALNLIDVVFKDSETVREAWAELYLSFDTSKQIPAHTQEERIRSLLKAIAVDIGLSDGLRLDDFGRVYYPNALAEEDAVRRLELQAAMKRLRPDAPPAANTSPVAIDSPYPPRPTAAPNG